MGLCSHVILLGDLNYRISLPEETTRLLVEKGDWDSLLENDQVYIYTWRLRTVLELNPFKYFLSNLIIFNENEAKNGANDWKHVERMA